jgi:RimJ/RimL family protein N-acetyltransferase
VFDLFDFDVFPVLETGRLLLREITLNDADALLRIRGDSQVTRYNGGNTFTFVDEAIDLVQTMTRAYREKREIRWGITLKPVDSVIGMVGFNYWNRQDFRGSVGYDLARAYWGRNIMPEALREVVSFGFDCMGLNRIEADASAANRASVRVLEKLGFKYEGLQREQYYENGEFHDLLLYALLRREFA